MTRSFLARRWPEIALVLLGCSLRAALGASYEVRLGYDFYHHALTVAWWVQHFQLPPIEISRTAYHPPLYYLLAGGLGRAGLGFVGLGLCSLALGCLRLGLLAVALVLYLPQQRLPRLSALALAAVLPASVHMDIMMTNEPLTATLATLALVLFPLAFAESSRTRWRASVGLGIVLGLALLTKVSSFVIVVALVAAVGLTFVRERGLSVRTRLRRLAPPVAALAIALVCSGWYFARCKAVYGKLVINGYDNPNVRGELIHNNEPLWSRRPASYFFGWNLDIYRFPFYPSAALPDARFFPQVIASTFADYYNYGLAPYPPFGTPALKANLRPLRPAVVTPAAVSVACGTFIALLTFVAFVGAVVWCWRRRAHAMLGLLLVPVLALAGQAYFAASIANDAEGLVKGSYLQLAAAPLFALFGLAVSWAWQRRALRAVAVLALVAVAGVAEYVVFCIFFAA
jgi:4-amino-4-deoxy-L-arabinose transferase-like glycosyltransferase